VVLGCLVGLSGLAYWNEWQRELTQATSLARAAAAGTAEQIGGSLRTIDLLIQSVGRSSEGRSAAEDRETSLGVSLGAVPEMQALILTTADGRVVGPAAGEQRVANERVANERVDGRDFFTLQRRMFRDDKVVVDGPRHDPLTGKAEIVLSRPLLDEAGNFAGVIAAVLRSDFFANPLMAANLERHGIAAVFNVNGVTFSRFPEIPQAVGTLVPTAWMAEGGRRREEGTVRGTGLIDDADAIVAYRAVRNYPLTVAVSVSVSAIKDAWLRSVTPRLAIEGVIMLMLVGLATLFDIGERKRRRVAQELAVLNSDLEQRVAERTASLRLEISDRIRAEEETARLENAYRDLFDGSLEGLAICRGKALVLFNQAFSRMFCLGNGEALDSITQPIAEHHRAELERAAAGVLQSGLPVTLDVEGRFRDVGGGWFRTSIRRVRWEGLPAVQAAFVDITAAKKGEEQILAAKLAAESANSLKSRFLAVASHDLRQPVQAIALYANVLCKRALGTEMAEIVSRLADSSGELSRLLDSLLDISKLEAGRVQPCLQRVALQPLLETLWSCFADTAEQAGVSLTVVPAALTVESDPVLLGRILQNLLSNAIRYTPRGGKVLVGCRRQGQRIGMTVLDNGEGISDGERERIFREFYRTAAAGRKAERGLGLGLSIVDRLVHLLGHSLTVTSQKGHGSAFTLWLSRAEPAPEDATPPVPPAPAPAPPGGLAGRRILVVDDDPQVRDSLALQLRDWAMEVVEAAAGGDAVQAIRSGFRPDLMVVDRTLGDGETGQAVIGAVEAVLGQRLPAIMLTGDTAPADLAAAGWSRRSLHKPVRPDELAQAIAAELAGM
jgi:PAS domain S-box-containing protein